MAALPEQAVIDHVAEKRALAGLFLEHGKLLV